MSATKPIAIAIIGAGKIARDQHLPAIAANSGFHLVASVSPSSRLPGIPSFPDLESLRQSGPTIDAVALCTPPQMRPAIARACLAAGLHTLLEKPPAATLGACAWIADAAPPGVTLFASWHSRFAAMVEPARQWLSTRTIRRGKIIWREDVRQWHPGQRWLWEAGGMGVFDPGINAFSILTRLLREPLIVTAAQLEVPANAQTPIAARLRFQAGDAPIEVDLDFRQTGEQSWRIELETSSGEILRLDDGGARMSLNGTPQPAPAGGEYPRLYARFHDLIRTRQSDMDTTPLRLVADSFMIGEIKRVEAFLE